RLNKPRRRAVVFLAGTRIEVLDDFDRFHGFIQRSAERLGNFLELFVLKLVKVFADDRGTYLVVFAQHLKLDHQTFTEVAGRDSGRVERLNDLERLLNLLESVFAAFCNFLEGNLNLATVFIDSSKVPVFIEIANDRMTGKADGFIDGSQAE